VDVGQAAVDTVVTERQLRVVDPEEVQDRGVKVGDRDLLLGREVADLVARPIREAAFHASAGKKADRAAKEGTIASYIHMQGKVGVLVEINCETDFVAKNDNFRDFVKDITLHIAAAHPLYVTRAQVPEALITKEREIAAAQVVGKPANIVDKIVDGKIDKFYSTICLLEQSFIKNPDVTIEDLVKSKIAELGENIIIRRFTRYGVGEELA
jgi:elongation factor Ts